MTEKRVVPQAIDPFNSYILVVLSYLTANASRLLITTGNITALNDLVTNATTGWTHWYTLHANAATRTSVINANLADSETAITQKLQSIYGDLPRSLMTNEDYQTLHISPPVTHRAKRAKITNIPFSKVYSVGGAIVKFIIRTDTHAKRAAIDPLADAVEVVAVLLSIDKPLPTDPSECNLHFISKEALFGHAFTPADAGMRFACFIRFVNLTDESKDGGWSGVISCIVGM